jgi:hypothetical protein
MSERACATCEWWDQKTSRNRGLCRILPPRKNGGDEGEYNWPTTYDEDWCGKFQAKEELPRQKMHDPVSAYEEQNWRSRGDSEEDIAARIAARGRA